MFISEDVLILFLCFVIFATLHSVLAAESIKVRTFSKLPSLARFYRLIYNFVAVLTLLPFFFIAGMKASPVVFSMTGSIASIIYLIKLISFIFLLISIRPVLSDLSGMMALRGDSENGPLITSGMYAVTRHPIYLFTLIFLWANPRMTANALAAYMLVTTYTYIGSLFEERRLMNKFSGYEEYRRTTSGIIPFKWIIKSVLKFKAVIPDSDRESSDA